jgi:hypothetical protein
MISTIFYTVTVSYDSGPRVWLFASERDAVAHIAMMFPETWEHASDEAEAYGEEFSDMRHTSYFFYRYVQPEAAKNGLKVNLQHHEMWFNISHRKGE